MKKKNIIVSVVTLLICLSTVYPLYRVDMNNYSSGMFASYYIIFLWRLWGAISLLFLFVFLVFEKFREKNWKLILSNFLLIILIVGGTTSKLIYENKENQRRYQLKQKKQGIEPKHYEGHNH